MMTVDSITIELEKTDIEHHQTTRNTIASRHERRRLNTDESTTANGALQPPSFSRFHSISTCLSSRVPKSESNKRKNVVSRLVARRRCSRATAARARRLLPDEPRRATASEQTGAAVGELSNVDDTLSSRRVSDAHPSMSGNRRRRAQIEAATRRLLSGRRARHRRRRRVGNRRRRWRCRRQQSAKRAASKLAPCQPPSSRRSPFSLSASSRGTRHVSDA